MTRAACDWTELGVVSASSSVITSTDVANESSRALRYKWRGDLRPRRGTSRLGVLGKTCARVGILLRLMRCHPLLSPEVPRSASNRRFFGGPVLESSPLGGGLMPRGQIPVEGGVVVAVPQPSNPP